MYLWPTDPLPPEESLIIIGSNVIRDFADADREIVTFHESPRNAAIINTIPYFAMLVVISGFGDATIKAHAVRWLQLGRCRRNSV